MISTKLRNYEFSLETYKDFVREWKKEHNMLVKMQQAQKRIRRDGTDKERSHAQYSVQMNKQWLTHMYELRMMWKNKYKMEIKNGE